MEAAQALLDQHQSFTEVQLIDYISECFPEVPPWERRALVIGAVTGAQMAARLQCLYEKNRESPDSVKREMATNAGSALSFWNMGLWAQPGPTSIPTPVSAVGECTEVPWQNADAQVLDRVKLPVPFGATCCDMDLLREAMHSSGVQEMSHILSKIDEKAYPTH